MGAFRKPLFSVFYYIALSISICICQQLECNKGSLTVRLENKAEGFIKINCNPKTVIASVTPVNTNRCYEQGNSTLPLIKRSSWNAVANSRAPEEKTKPSEYVLVDASSYVTTVKDYAEKMRALQLYQNKEFGSLMENFYVSDDGKVYEGIGWDHFNRVRGGGLNSLRIGFLKETSEAAPSPSAEAAFMSLIKAAVCLGKLNGDYKLIPFYHVYDYDILSTDYFERNGMSKWERYYENTDLGREKPKLGVFPLIFREDWNAEPMRHPTHNRSMKIDFVVVGNSKGRCFDTKQCMSILKDEERDFFSKNRDFPINFMFGEDGFAYEIFGWDKTWDTYWLGKKAIAVDFFGQFHNYPPTSSALLAFERLMRFGVLWGKLSPDYKIVSMWKVYSSKNVMGEMLQKEIQKMDRFSDDF